MTPAPDAAGPPRTRLAVGLAGLAVLAAGCGGTAPDGTATGTPTGTPASTTAAPATPATTAPAGGDGPDTTPTPAGVSARITVTEGQVEGPDELEVPVGRRVTLTVSSDRADRVHVHGYDLLEEVTAGGTATITFTADIPGQFEVELEGEHQHLIDLLVR